MFIIYPVSAKETNLIIGDWERLRETDLVDLDLLERDRRLEDDLDIFLVIVLILDADPFCSLEAALAKIQN